MRARSGSGAAWSQEEAAGFRQWPFWAALGAGEPERSVFAESERPGEGEHRTKTAAGAAEPGFPVISCGGWPGSSPPVHQPRRVGGGALAERAQPRRGPAQRSCSPGSGEGGGGLNALRRLSHPSPDVSRFPGVLVTLSASGDALGRGAVGRKAPSPARPGEWARDPCWGPCPARGLYQLPAGQWPRLEAPPCSRLAWEPSGPHQGQPGLCAYPVFVGVWLPGAGRGPSEGEGPQGRCWTLPLAWTLWAQRWAQTEQGLAEHPPACQPGVAGSGSETGGEGAGPGAEPELLGESSGCERLPPGPGRGAAPRHCAQLCRTIWVGDHSSFLL